MTDYIAKLYDLPNIYPTIEKLSILKIDIRRGVSPEKHIIVNWVREQCNDRYASECEVSFSQHPITCFIATKNSKILGFACYDATAKAYFGPTEVIEEEQGKGIGKGLLLASLHDMSAQGYAYAIIGRADPDAITFYEKVVGAQKIEGSAPGIYRGMLG